MANNNDCNNLTWEMEETGIPDLQRKLQNAAIDEINNLGIELDQGDDVVNDDVSEMTGQDEDSVGGMMKQALHLVLQAAAQLG